MGTHLPAPDAVADISALAAPVRRRLYDVVAAADEPVGREDAAAAAGISRTLAAYHLDRLAAAGLLMISTARAGGRAGPGAGRPAKRYRRADQDVVITVPPRDYALLASLLANVISGEGMGAVRVRLLETARQEGCAAAGMGEDLATALTMRGYEPAATGEGDVELRNCPFHRLSQRHPGLVCGLNAALLRGLLEARGEDPDRAVPAPRPDRCCILIRRARGWCEHPTAARPDTAT